MIDRGLLTARPSAIVSSIMREPMDDPGRPIEILRPILGRVYVVVVHIQHPICLGLISDCAQVLKAWFMAKALFGFSENIKIMQQVYCLISSLCYHKLALPPSYSLESTHAAHQENQEINSCTD
jgi:hypothetical protein